MVAAPWLLYPRLPLPVSDPAPVVIVGAGPVGLFTALQLVEAGQPVVVLEKLPETLGAVKIRKVSLVEGVKPLMRVALRAPSSVDANFATTYGRPERRWCR